MTALLPIRAWRRRLLALRAVLVAFLLLAALALTGQRQPFMPLSITAAWLAVLWLPSLLYLTTRHLPFRFQAGLLWIELTFDCLLFLALIHYLGGSANPLAFYLLAPMLISALTLAPQANISIVALCILGYGVTLYWHRIPDTHSHLHALTHDLNSLHGQGMWLAFSLMAVILAMLGHALQRAQQQQRLQSATALTLALQRERMYQLAGALADRAHELNTPLSTLVLMLDELASGDQPPGVASLETMQGLVNRMVEVLKNDQRTRPAPEAIRFTALCTQLRTALHRLAPGLEVHAGTEPNAWLEPADAWQRIFLNLGYNACDAGAQALHVSCRYDHHDLLLQVSDDGPRHASRERAGLGIGLALIETTLATLGGSLDLRQHPQWTQILIRCPLPEKERE